VACREGALENRRNRYVTQRALVTHAISFWHNVVDFSASAMTDRPAPACCVEKAGILDMTDNRQQKDIWDRLTALATILVPAAIALAGHFIAQGLKQAELSSEERRAQQSSAIAEANMKIAQAGLINTMMKSLTSQNPQERKLAVEAVLIALPEQGPILVRTIAQSDEDKTVQIAAKSSLEQRFTTLIRQLFADDARSRIDAASELIQGWRNEPNAVNVLIEFANQNIDNANGIYNTIVVLNEFSKIALDPHKEKLLKFAALAKTKGSKTEAKVMALIRRLDSGSDP